MASVKFFMLILSFNSSGKLYEERTQTLTVPDRAACEMAIPAHDLLRKDGSRTVYRCIEERAA